jgi:hypothetical protein
MWADSSLKCNACDVIDFEPGEDFVRRFEVQDGARCVVQDELQVGEIFGGEG